LLCLAAVWSRIVSPLRWSHIEHMTEGLLPWKTYPTKSGEKGLLKNETTIKQRQQLESNTRTWTLKTVQYKQRLSTRDT